eukprot:6092266-Amphidinium_carterae.5
MEVGCGCSRKEEPTMLRCVIAYKISKSNDSLVMHYWANFTTSVMNGLRLMVAYPTQWKDGQGHELA